MAKQTTFDHPPRGHVALLAYDSVNDRWQAVYVDASGNLQVEAAALPLPTGAATEATLADCKTALELIDDLRGALDSVGTDELDVNVENGVQVRVDDHVVAEYSGVKGDTDWHDLVNVSGAGTLEWMTAGDNWSTSVFRVTVDGDYLYMLQPFGPEMDEEMKSLYLTLGSEEDSLWKLHVHDAANYRFFFFLKRPVWFGSSLRIEYKAGNAATKIIMACGYHLR